MAAVPQRDIRILADPAAVTRRAADEFVKAANNAVAQKGMFSVALSGGSTPKSLYALLADDPGYQQSSLGQNARLFR